MKVPSDSHVVDSAFLFMIVSLSALPYLFSLGFYSDDWGYQSVLSNSHDHGLGAMFWNLVAVDVDMRVRPIQAVLLVLNFSLFGRHVLPYHITGTAFLGLLATCVYLTIRQLHNDRRLAFTIALVFGLLPHYSTDRFWIASQQAIL